VTRWICLLVLASCAPSVPSSYERADASDRAEAAALDGQLLAVPGVTGAYAAIHRAFTDPLTGAHSDPAASVLITIALDADRATVERTAHQLAPTARLAIITAPSPTAPSKRTPVLILALIAILGAAGYVAWRSRPSRFMG
jgi:hypothetical protein